jgi:hypothetical protein
VEIEVEQLSLHFNGDVSPERARVVADLSANGLRAALTPHTERLARAAGDSYRLAALSVPPLYLPHDATDADVARLTTAALADALLRGLAAI